MYNLFSQENLEVLLITLQEKEFCIKIHPFCLVYHLKNINLSISYYL